MISKVSIFIEIPGADSNVSVEDVTVELPSDFFDFADNQLKLNGQLISFLDSEAGGYSVENIGKLGDRERNSHFKNKTTSTKWDACYRKTESGNLISILVEFPDEISNDSSEDILEDVPKVRSEDIPKIKQEIRLELNGQPRISAIQGVS